jgi:O-antigen/teichoic acid export membrane protein
VNIRLLRIGAEASWVLAGQIGVAAGGILSIKILTHILTPYEFGRLSVANTIILLIGINLFGPMGQGLMRFWSIAQDWQDLNAYVQFSRKYIRLLIFAVVALSFVFVVGIRFSSWKDWAFVFALAMIVGAFSGWGSIRLSTLMAARKRKNAALINATTAFAKPIVAAALMIIWSECAEFAILGFLVVTLVSSCFTEYWYKQTVKGRYNELAMHAEKKTAYHLGNEILKFSFPFFIWAIFGWVHQSCDRWALVSFYGADVVGAFSVITQLSVYPIIFGSNFLSTYLLPIAYQRAGELQSNAAVKGANRILYFMTGLFIAGTAILLVIFQAYHRQIILAVSNAEYIQYSYLLPALTGVWALYYLGQLLTSFGLLVKKTRAYLLPIISSGLIAVMATFFLSFKQGPVGVVWGLGISGVIYALWCLLIARRLIKKL